MNPKQIKALRERLCLTQAELAKAIGKHKTTVERWERGIGKPDKMQIYYLENILE